MEGDKGREGENSEGIKQGEGKEKDISIIIPTGHFIFKGINNTFDITMMISVFLSLKLDIVVKKSVIELCIQGVHILGRDGLWGIRYTT